MPIITISRGTYSHGEDIAGAVALKLGYRCIGPEMLHSACRHLEFQSADVERAVNDAPHLLEQVSGRREQILALFRSVFYDYMSRDNVVYHGRAGHIFLADVPGVLKVRIIAEPEDRIREAMERESLTYGEARKKLQREDRERVKWTSHIYGKDNRDPQLYDIHLNLRNITVSEAVSIIVGTARVSTVDSGGMMCKRLADLALAAKIEARLLAWFPEVEAVAKGGEVFVSVTGSILQEETIVNKAKELLSGIEGIRTLNIGVAPSVYVPF